MSKWNKIRKTHPNSVESYHEGRLNGEFNKREWNIMTAFRQMGKATDREIKDFLELDDMNDCRPRISELINHAGLLEECGHSIDDKTGRPVRVIRIIPKDSAKQLNLF